jgi:hypothetical protein
MAKNRKPRARPVHPSIKIALGYDPNLADQEVLQDWSERKRRVLQALLGTQVLPVRAIG